MQLEALQTLSDLYGAALRLPDVDVHDAPEPPSQTKNERQRLAKNLATLPFQYYWEVFTPTDIEGNKEPEPVSADLFDDVLDIYGDIASGLWLYDQNHFEAAVFNWRLTFGIHWGRHLVSALHALHSFEPRDEQDEYNEWSPLSNSDVN
jgi:uncharacterized protein DUF5063